MSRPQCVNDEPVIPIITGFNDGFSSVRPKASTYIKPMIINCQFDTQQLY